MNNFLQRVFKGDRYVWIVFIALCIISIIEMFSASSSLVSRSGSIHAPIMRHVSFMAAGFVLILLIQLVDFKWMRLGGYIFWAFSIALLVYTLAFGVEQAGSARFLNIAGFQFQPSEFAKISLVLVVADQIERMQDIEYQARYFWWVLGGVILTCLLIFLENLSTAALLFGTVLCMMFIGEVSWKRLVASLSIVLVGLTIILSVAAIIPESVYRENDNKVVKLFDRAYTWVARINNFVSPSDADSEQQNKYVITDKNYQASHAQIAVARGGFLPHMPGSSVQRDYLPEAFSDYIFAIIIEEGGFFVGLIVIALYLILLYRAYKVAKTANSLFCAIVVIGVSLLIVFQALIHIAVSVHLIPVTGQPLPLVSRGGTSMIVNCIYFGIIISITRSIYTENETSVENAVAAESAAIKPQSQDDTLILETTTSDSRPASTPDDDEVVIEVATPSQANPISGEEDEIIITEN